MNYSLHINRIPRWLFCTFNFEKSYLALQERRDSYIPPCPIPIQPLHERLQPRVLLCTLAARHFHEEQLKLFAVFLSLNGNLLLYKFHTVILALTFGSIQNTHILLSPVISLVIYRFSVLFSRLDTSRCYNHSLHSFIHPLLVYFYWVLTTSSH